MVLDRSTRGIRPLDFATEVIVAQGSAAAGEGGQHRLGRFYCDLCDPAEPGHCESGQDIHTVTDLE